MSSFCLLYYIFFQLCLLSAMSSFYKEECRLYLLSTRSAGYIFYLPYLSSFHNKEEYLLSIIRKSLTDRINRSFPPLSRPLLSLINHSYFYLWSTNHLYLGIGSTTHSHFDLRSAIPTSILGYTQPFLLPSGITTIPTSIGWINNHSFPPPLSRMINYSLSSDRMIYYSLSRIGSTIPPLLRR